MTTAATTLLGLALPVTGELSGTWGDTVNNSITNLLDTAVAGTTTLSTDVDVTLTTTTLAANQARQAILLCSGARTALRTITAPAQSKIYTIINATTGGFSVKLVGVGPTTGVTIVAGESAVCAWNGSDFIKVSNTAGGGTFTDLTVSNSLTLSYGTANGVLYLNGSKVATSGSALTFDGTGVTIGAAASASTRLTVNGPVQFNASTDTNTYIAFQNTTYLNASGSLVFAANSAEGMRLTSTGLGIGTSSPAYKLDVKGNSAVRAPGTSANTSSTLYLIANNNGGDPYCFTSINAVSEGSTWPSAIAFYTRNSSAIDAEKMRLDSSGNLGLGVTPSAWGGTYKAEQIGAKAALSYTTLGNGYTLLTHNGYDSGVGSWKYLANGYASQYTQVDGTHQWTNAASGTAGNTITFTQAMTLDASGNLLVNTTSAVSGSKLVVDSGDATIYGVTVGRGAGAVSTNTAVGATALAANTTGYHNVAVGYQTLATNTASIQNVAMGLQALYTNDGGNYNTAYGHQALRGNTTASYNTAVGYQSLYTNSTGDTLTAVGTFSGYSNTTGIDSTFIGYSAGYSNTTGAQNAALGKESLAFNTTGNYNTAIGRSALRSNTTASYNTAIGYQAGYSNTTGVLTAIGYQAGYSHTTNATFQNTFVGNQAGLLVTTGAGHTYVGHNAGSAMTTNNWSTAVGYGALRLSTGGVNTAVGAQALELNTTGTNNTSLGYAALYSNTTASNNTAVGYQALYTNSTGLYSVAVGYQAAYTNNGGGIVAIGNTALFSNTTGTSNVAVGSTYNTNAPLYYNTTGSYNVAFGEGALKSNTTASQNTAIGYSALWSNTTANYNTAVGYQAGYTNTTGQYNTYIGRIAGYSNSTGNYITAVGHNALNACTGDFNTAVGRDALYLSTSGVENTAVGANAMDTNTTGSYNTAVGKHAVKGNTTGNNNTGVGYQTLYSATTPTNQAAFGYRAGYAVTTGGSNTLVGSQTAYGNGVDLTTGSNNTIIGAFSRTSAADSNNQIVIGNNVQGQADNNVTIGSNSGKIYNAYTSNATWTQTSDGRLKTNVQDDSLGLSFINRLRPVKFNWKASNEIDQSLPYYNEVNQRDTSTVIHGLIAQEVKAALDAEGVSTFAGWDVGPDGIQAISREMFISPLIKAIQELKAELDSVKAELATLKGN